MSELLRVDTEKDKLKVCGKCKYSTSDKNGTSHMVCSYIEREGHSRILLDGKRAVPKGYCDKWEQKKVRKEGESMTWQQVY